MTGSGLLVNAVALLAITVLLPHLVHLARQGRSLDHYYNEEIYYDEKAVDGSADFSEDLTYAQYDLGEPAEPYRNTDYITMQLVFWRKWFISLLLGTSTSPSTEKNATSTQSAALTRPGTRRIHVARQQDVSTLRATERAETAPAAATETGSSVSPAQLPTPKPNITGLCHTLRSEAWRQVSMYANCLELSDVIIDGRRSGELRFIRHFRTASQTTDILWHYLAPRTPDDTEEEDSKDCDWLQTSTKPEFCIRNFDKAMEVVRVLEIDPTSDKPNHRWEIFCRVVWEYKYCVSELVTCCHGIVKEIIRPVPVRVLDTTSPYCHPNCGDNLVVTAMWAVAVGITTLWSRAPWRP